MHSNDLNPYPAWADPAVRGFIALIWICFIGYGLWRLYHWNHERRFRKKYSDELMTMKEIYDEFGDSGKTDREVRS